MAASTAQIGTRIRLWRERLGFSVPDVAAKVGLPPSTFESAERGESVLSAYQLHRVAQALGTSIGVLASTRVADTDPVRGAIRFRTGASLAALSSEDARLLIVARGVGAAAGHWAKQLGRTVPIPEAREVPVGTVPWKHGYDLGETLRADLGVRGPVVDIVAFLGRLGVHVAEVDFSDKNLYAAAIRDKRAIPIILVNRNRRQTSQRALRATIAHELCHLLYDADVESLVTSVSRRGDVAEAREQRANGFAPSFLAPAAEVLAYSTNPVPLAQHLVDEWGFSGEGAAWHVRNLLRLPEADVSGIRSSLRVHGGTPPRFRVAFPQGASSTWTSGLIADIIRDAEREELIGSGRLDELLQAA